MLLRLITGNCSQPCDSANDGLVRRVLFYEAVGDELFVVCCLGRRERLGSVQRGWDRQRALSAICDRLAASGTTAMKFAPTWYGTV